MFYCFVVQIVLILDRHDDNKLTSVSIISVDQLTNTRCTTTIYTKKVKVKNNKKIIMTGTRNKQNKSWQVNIFKLQ